MSSDKKLRERVKALGKRPGKADMEKFVQDITPQQRKEMQLRWVKADIGPGEDGRVCLSLVADLTAGKPMSKDGHVSVSSSAMFGVPTLIGSLHVDALSYLEECGCCGEKGKELRHCSACYLVKYCGESSMAESAEETGRRGGSSRGYTRSGRHHPDKKNVDRGHMHDYLGGAEE